MKINRKNIIKYLDNFDFESLFIEELGWDYPEDETDKYITVDERVFTVKPIADKRGFNVFTCSLDKDSIPLSNTLKKIDKEVSKYSYEHFIIYNSRLDNNQKWQWIKKEINQPLVNRTIEYSSHKKESLLQVLDNITIALDEEDSLSLLKVKSKAKKAFDVDKVTKKFYDKFKKQHNQFLGFIEGISVDFDKEWYASLMLNRLMFVYFIQKKGFLNSDMDYLNNKLNECRQEKGKDKFYSFYRYFLLKLFHDGLGNQNRPPELNQLLGKIPYLNGGLFEIHPLENKYPDIEIKDKAFEDIFTFFDQYNWHLDDRPLKSDNEINPDVLGYIFEKYINQKQMGAYYTKEDITEYISKNCIIPYLFDSITQDLQPNLSEQQIQSKLGFYLLSENPNRYIYDAVQKGIDLPLPDDIAKGIDQVSERDNWNKSAHDDYALPTEIWREVVARRKRYSEIREKLKKGEITSINDLITHNLNIRQFAQDAISVIDCPLTLKNCYEKLTTMSILDPTCGSGAFLFAALNILEPLYDGCLDQMQEFIDEEKSLQLTAEEKQTVEEFNKILSDVKSHINRKYFILKNIILNNLYGVDIMEEATEVCKLRLFLKLASQVTPNPNAQNYGIEPLPDIDFNIRSGNSLVGFANYEEVEKAVKGDRQGKLDLYDDMAVINTKAKVVSEVYQTFRSIQIQSDGVNFSKTKAKLKENLASLNEELNNYLAKEYGIDVKKKKDYEKWLTSHQPFHWFTEFYSIINNDGFDVIIGNPPYVEYNKVKKDYQIKSYKTEKCGNLYVFTIETCLNFSKNNSYMGMIVQLPIICTDRMKPIQKQLKEKSKYIYLSNFDDRPAKLFDGLEHIRANIFILSKAINYSSNQQIFSTNYNRWYSEQRLVLFENQEYQSIFNYLFDGTFPKIGQNYGKLIIDKLNKLKSINNYIIKDSEHVVYFHNAPQYWIRAMNFTPYFWNEKDGEKISSHLKSITFKIEIDALTIVAILNSSLFYWWFIILSNCRDLTAREINNFPVGLDKMNNSIKEKLGKLAEDLMEDLRVNSVRKECNYKTTGQVIYDEYYPKKSKLIIDEIDKVLAQHYGFSDEELDFIINYDIKYRMGKELDSD